MTALPTGIVTFLLTDIEGSSRLWERDEVAMARAARRHDALLGQAIAAHGGVLFKHVGDAVQAAFDSPVAAVGAAVAAQRAVAAEPWPETEPIRVRMGIHLGEATPNARGDYHQVACLNRAHRLMSAGHGGQVLLSAIVRLAVSTSLPAGVTLRDLGRHRLRDLLEPEEIAQLVIPGLDDTFPLLKTLEGHANNLPTLPTALLGREAELDELATHLGGENGHARLVTLVGPGGVGKTHLALQAAADLLDRFEDGIWLVRLGETDDPRAIVPTIAATLGIREGGGLTTREALLHWIDARRVLFVIDNLEQIAGAGKEIADLLAACPRARVLATSRARLRAAGEMVVSIDPLPLPAAGETASVEESAAAQLFLERAAAVIPGFALDERSAPVVATICARLDGLPLAIELAAAQLRTRTLPELLADLERRFDVLTGGRPEGLTHQQSLGATIAWSYDRLDPAAQRLLRHCAVFAGGWSREAAAAVAVAGGEPRAPEAVPPSDMVVSLATLTEQSLVRRGEVETVSRWSMLESIRAFARERLEEAGEAGAARQRHAAWCLRFAETAATRLDGAEQIAWLGRLDLEHDNARAALRWYDEASAAAGALALAAALAGYWRTRGYLSEGRRWLEAALAREGQPSPARLQAMIEAGVLAQSQGDASAARGWLGRALDMARASGDRGREAAIVNNLGALALEQGELEAAERLFMESLALAEALRDVRQRGDVLANLAAAAHYRDDLALALRRYLESLHIWQELEDWRGIADMLLNILLLLAPQRAEHDRARAAGEEALRHFRELGEPQGEALALSGLGLVAAVRGEYERAVALYEESLRLARRLDDRATEARVLGNLVAAELDRGYLDRAAALLADSVSLVRALGDQDGMATALEAAAALHAVRGADERAARLSGAARALRERIGVPAPPESRERTARVVAELMRRLGDRYHDALAAGAALGLEDALREATAPADSPPAGNSLAASLSALDDVLGIGTPGGGKEQSSGFLASR